MKSHSALRKYSKCVLFVLSVRLALPLGGIVLSTLASFADVHQATTNAQAGLDQALRTSFPSEKKYIRIEKRGDGTLIYKVSMRRVDEQTVRFRITGYDGPDEVSIVTYRIAHDNSYKTIQEYKRWKQNTTIKPGVKDVEPDTVSEKRGVKDD